MKRIAKGFAQAYCEWEIARVRAMIEEADALIARARRLSCAPRPQRTMIAAELANLKQGRPESNAQDCAITSPAITQTAAAEMMNVSRRTVRDAKAIRDHAPDDPLPGLLADECEHLRGLIARADALIERRRARRLCRRSAPPTPKAQP